MQVYLAGPMSGKPHWNYPEFMRTAAALRKQGYDVLNPAESHLGLGYERVDYLRDDFSWIAKHAEAIAILPWWFFSEGARTEVHIARTLGLPIIDAGMYLPFTNERNPQFGQPFEYDEIAPEAFAGTLVTTFNPVNEEPVPLMVALSGKMKAGKDTVGEELRRLTYVPKGSFAAPLKSGCEIFGIGVSEETKDRTVLQEIGEYFTQRNPTHWVDLLDERHINRDKTGIIITDLRNDGELDWCKRNGIVTVRLQVSKETQLARGAEPDRLDHPTETRMDSRTSEFDIVIEEGCTVEEAVDTILNHTGSKKRLALFETAQVYRVPGKEHITHGS